MLRVIAAFATGLCLLIAVPHAQTISFGPSHASPAIFDELYQAYAGGDLDVLAKRVVGNNAIDFHYSVQKALERPPQPLWTRMLPAFLLEVAVFEATHGITSDVVPCISRGRLLVSSRPWPLGADAAEDAFELQWHRLALAVLQRRLADETEEIYLDTLERRYLTSKAAQTARTTFDPHFVLDRAIADEQTAYRLATTASGMPGTMRLTALAKPSDGGKLATTLKHALKAAEEAAALPEVAVEARLRQAVLFVKLGQFEEALSALRKVNTAEADVVQQYWATIVEARVLHELKRLPDAERVYRGAVSRWPDVPSPITGLALVLFDMNRREEAAETGAALRALTSADFDPWWSYLGADGRFILRWRDVLRGLLK